MKRYGVVLALALVAALVLGAVARLPRGSAERAPVAPAVPSLKLKVAFAAGAARPEAASVPVGHRVEATLVNEDSRVLTIGLAGYEDRVPAAAIAPGSSRTVGFVADRPGEAFAWLVDGEPCGRLAVTGSHLEEGHR